jgi:hypothetical protein
MPPFAAASSARRWRGARSVGSPRGSRRSHPSRRPCSLIASPRYPTMATSPASRTAHQSTFSWAARPASPSASQASEADWLTRAATWPLSSFALLAECGPAGWSGRMCPVSCRVDEDATLVPSSGSWGNAGMGSPTEFLTLSGSEYPSDAAACSLSAILETGDVPPQYFLSARACRGILRRAEKRGRTLPGHLADVLRAVAGALEQMKPQRGKSSRTP